MSAPLLATFAHATHEDKSFPLAAALLGILTCFRTLSMQCFLLKLRVHEGGVQIFKLVVRVLEYRDKDNDAQERKQDYSTEAQEVISICTALPARPRPRPIRGAVSSLLSLNWGSWLLVAGSQPPNQRPALAPAPASSGLSTLPCHTLREHLTKHFFT